MCPLCGAGIPEWEGYGGPGAFLAFRQGEAAPVERRLASQEAPEDVTLPAGRLPLFGRCAQQHSTMAEAVVSEGVWRHTEIVDTEGGDGLPLVGPWVMWRATNGRFGVSTLAPTAAQGVVPASITAIGFNESCILATRRTDTRDPAFEDEWFLVDVGEIQVVGPVPDGEVAEALSERGLTEPAIMKLPEDLGLRR